MNGDPMRIRVTYAKQGELRYTGHLDLQRVWERTLRRSTLPIVFSQGFNPLPKLQLASALPLGIESVCEMMDFWLGEKLALLEITRGLKDALPPGLEVIKLIEVELKAPALETQLKSAEYRVTFRDPVDLVKLEKKVTGILTEDSLPRDRRGKTYDLRPLIEGLRIEPDGSLWMKLALRPGATGRPEEVLMELDLDWMAADVYRREIKL
ncbi:MAG: TIGR03936 family radical SAM-associated protein [Anaerolineaceae bacterium]